LGITCHSAVRALLASSEGQACNGPVLAWELMFSPFYRYGYASPHPQSLSPKSRCVKTMFWSQPSIPLHLWGQLRLSLGSCFPQHHTHPRNEADHRLASVERRAQKRFTIIILPVRTLMPPPHPDLDSGFIRPAIPSSRLTA
jgi:hypothetical protein